MRASRSGPKKREFTRCRAFRAKKVIWLFLFCLSYSSLSVFPAYRAPGLLGHFTLWVAIGRAVNKNT